MPLIFLRAFPQNDAFHFIFSPLSFRHMFENIHVVVQFVSLRGEIYILNAVWLLLCSLMRISSKWPDNELLLFWKGNDVYYSLVERGRILICLYMYYGKKLQFEEILTYLIYVYENCQWIWSSSHKLIVIKSSVILFCLCSCNKQKDQ